jgi:hypothetical protein
MDPFKIELSLPVVAPLLDVVKELADGLKQTLAVPPTLPGTDTVLRDLWTQELLTAQNEDVSALMGLFNEEFFTEGVVALGPGNAEAIARACSAIRLRLRERYLVPLGDEALEIGEVELGRLDAPTRKAFMAYLFLATIQEYIIQRLDESIIGS